VNKLAESKKIRVAILDDHQSIIDGYLYRLNHASDIEVVATASYAEEFEEILASCRPDVLILDVFVPTTRENSNPYPILQAIPNWRAIYPNLAILVISMHNLRTLAKAIIEAGASGYILKDDRGTIETLDGVVKTVANGGVFFSKQIFDSLSKESALDSSLTPRQMQVLSLCAAYPDATTNELADRMGIEPSTVRNLLSGAYNRMKVNSRAAAIARAIHLGLIPPPNPQLDR
jgi:two-component system nitrate/nitrite response regulator NarL